MRIKASLLPTAAFCLVIWNLATVLLLSETRFHQHSVFWEPHGIHNPLLSEYVSNALPIQHPTHASCNGFDGIYHIHMADVEGGVGTALFQLVIGQILYAEEHNLKPWIHFGDLSRVIFDPVLHASGDGVRFNAMVGRNATSVQGYHRRDRTPGPPDPSAPLMQKELHFPGTGIWNHYFEPVSNFVPGDKSCEPKMYVTMSLYLIIPGLHGFSEDKGTRAWRYEYLPDYVSKPHLSLAEWFAPQRERAHKVVSKYFTLRPHLKQRVKASNPNCSHHQPCLGVHIRHSDKAAGRIQIPTSDFLPFVQAFLDAGGAHVYIATDSSSVLDEIHKEWPASVVQRIRTLEGIVRSHNREAVFDLSSHHRTNEEILVEIYALSECQFLIHSLSAVSEAAIWINLNLHNQSVNLEDPEHIVEHEFGSMVKLATSTAGRESAVLASSLPRKTEKRWWAAPELTQQSLPENEIRCNASKGVLLIRSVGAQAAGGAFFNSVLNQIRFAELHDLLPWIHLEPHLADFIFDDDAHGNSRNVTTIVKTKMLSTGDRDGRISSFVTAELTGNGVWETYFLPDSSFDVSSKECKDLPIFTLEEASVRKLHLGKGYIRAWRYDDVSADAWNPHGSPVHELFNVMREEATALVRTHFRFQPYLLDRVELVNPVNESQPCLSIHLRTGDKVGRYRKRIKATDFLEYIQAFLDAGGKSIYVASDSHRTIRYILKNFPADVVKMIRFQGEHVVRTTKVMPLHIIESHHRVNSEALVDVLAMSKCGALLHGYSTLAEAAIYLNPSLRYTSVNLEEKTRMSTSSFSKVVSTLTSSRT